MESQTQLPFEQRCPDEHAGPPPQVQAPPDEQPSPVAPHDWQLLPPVAHAGPVGGEVHTLPVQHPFGHDVASHTQLPFEHRCPAPHAAAAPHRQAPAGEQLSAVALSQATHWLPSMPQLPNPVVVHALLAQHPVGHEVELQTHAPFKQICPTPQGWPLPHAHAPEVQLSAFLEEQTVQAFPPVPHVAVPGVSHVAPTQQPFGQVALQPVHALFTQFSLGPHWPHADPPVPQAVVEVPGRHVVPEQHPLGHDEPLHTHAPLTQACPAPQGAPLPHLHAPAVQRSLTADAQTAHAPPPVPQEPVDWGSQMPFLQQPPGHDVPLQMQAPLEQTCPIAQTGPEPQPHVPPVQESARVASQAMHVAPSVPHVEADGVTHVVPMQQPPGQEPLAPDVHVHLPLTHACPAPHGEPLPHEQAPIAEHRSAFTESHVTHASPPNPQAESERELQLGPEQHPVAQVEAQPEQAPLLQVWPVGQLAQALPPLPHSPVVLPGWHRFPTQQPDPQDIRSHTHVPFRHRWPVAHAEPVPQRHCPADEQLSAAPCTQAAHAAPGAPQVASDSAVQALPEQHPFGQDVASHKHDPCEQCSPGPHGAPVPHRQAPSAEQSSAVSALHATQVEPADPHVASARVRQVAPSQHPSGQDMASHTHKPPRQRWPAPHAAWAPHLHWPSAQLSACVASQAKQACPPVPQVGADAGSLHVVPEQQPFGHTQPLHAPAVHVSPCGHAAQAWPALPHASVWVPVSHVAPLQQPVHDCPSHTHLPEAQRWPTPHAGPEPHLQAPFVSQPSLTPD